ncbi:Prefoldin subunit 3 [Galdieria sulphuraria]|nr:Prefoldin subunit 3 [Galdieria sulphuraria]
MFSVASFLLENTWGNSLVPAAKFLEDIDKVVEEHDSSLSRQKRSFQEKIPDLTNALQVVRWLQSSGDGEQKEPMETTFELADNVYSTAWVKNPQVVYLWLGANVMVEYSFEEAESLLKENLDGARDKIQQLEKDLAFLREQMTTTEVNISRVYTAQLKKQTSNVA